MKNLSTLYMGLELKNPLIVSSSGLTASVDKIKKIEEAGAGAVVLKSIFEEQIVANVDKYISENPGAMYADEASQYLSEYLKEDTVNKYLDLIKETKLQCTIPVIASVNCFSIGSWTSFAKKIEEAGADALELNVFIMPKDRNTTSLEYENEYISLVAKVKEEIKIPISVKISPYFTNVINVVDRLKSVGVDAVVLFNKFYELDIDINNLKAINSNVLSTEDNIHQSLRWVAIVSSKIRKLEVASSTGVHSAEGLIKQLLAGAQCVQICSVLYNKGFSEIANILEGLEQWMEEKNYNNISDFRANLNYKNVENTSYYERVQFMKYFNPEFKI